MKKTIPGKKKIVFVISNIHKSLAFEWIATGLLNDYELEYILLNPDKSPFETFLQNKKIKFKRVRYRGKQDFMSAFFSTFLYLVTSRPQTVHAHLFDAQLIGLSAAWLAGIKKRVYTRHNSNYHHVYHPKGVKYDRWSNRMATHIVSISQATDKTLIEYEDAPISKVVKIPHGFDLDSFFHVPDAQIDSLKTKWNIPNDRPVIGVIARHIEWKGIQFIIPAFQKFLESYPTAHLILANASGPYHNTIVKMLNEISTDRVTLIPFEEDVASLYSVFDMYIHTPIDSICEAFGQTYVEALAAGVPSIFTLSGVACEFVEHNRNALVVGYKNEEDIVNAMVQVWRDLELRKKLIKNGWQDVALRFGHTQMLTSHINLYES